MARGSYIDPAVLQLYETCGTIGGLHPTAIQLPADPGAERQVLRVLLDYHAATETKPR